MTLDDLGPEVSKQLGRLFEESDVTIRRILTDLIYMNRVKVLQKIFYPLTSETFPNFFEIKANPDKVTMSDRKIDKPDLKNDADGSDKMKIDNGTVGVDSNGGNRSMFADIFKEIDGKEKNLDDYQVYYNQRKY